MNNVNLTIYNKYSATYSSSALDLFKNCFFLGLSIFGVNYFKNSIFSLLTVPFLSLMLLRSFMIFHDCGHNSYTPNSKLNYAIGTVLGTFLLSPYSWNSKHYMHHLANGNIENKYSYRWSETVQYTVKQYTELDSGYQLLYRFFRDPVMFFTVVPFFQFFIMSRLYIFYSNGYNYTTKQTYIDCIINTFGIIVQQYIYYKYSIIIHYNIALYFTAIIGFILFHNQHTFNPAYIKKNSEWSMKESGLEGSSFITVPSWLKYFTMGIEYHHIHHCMTRIPGYNLQICHKYISQNTKMFDNIVVLSMKDVWDNIFLTLYDESSGKYISFTELENKRK
jgi:omega-6 fatty acid desaturase (delta-12 desaturase)